MSVCIPVLCNLEKSTGVGGCDEYLRDYTLTVSYKDMSVL